MRARRMRRCNKRQAALQPLCKKTVWVAEPLHCPRREQRRQKLPSCSVLPPSLPPAAAPARLAAAQLCGRRRSRPLAPRCDRLGQQSMSWLLPAVMRRSYGPGTLCSSIGRWVLTGVCWL